MSPVSMSLRCCGGGRLSFVVAGAAAAAGEGGRGSLTRAGGATAGAWPPRGRGQPASAARRAHGGRAAAGEGKGGTYLGKLPVHGVDLLLEAGDSRE